MAQYAPDVYKRQLSGICCLIYHTSHDTFKVKHGTENILDFFPQEQIVFQLSLIHISVSKQGLYATAFSFSFSFLLFSFSFACFHLCTHFLQFLVKAFGTQSRESLHQTALYHCFLFQCTGFEMCIRDRSRPMR